MTTTNIKNNSKIERFNFISNLILELDKEKQKLTQEKEDLVKIILKESPNLFEEALYKWAKEHPIEAISYIKAYECGIEEVYYQDGGEERLFQRSSSSNSKSTVYTLYDRKNLSSKTFYEGEIVEYYDKSNYSTIITLDFLNDYHIDILTDGGHYIHDECSTINIRTCSSIISAEEVVTLLKANLHLEVSYAREHKISFSKKGIVEFRNSYQSDLFGDLSNEDESADVFVILNNNIPVGLIEVFIWEDIQKIILDNIEFPEENRRLGYGRRTIEILRSMFPDYIIEGYSGENEDRCAFYASIGAEYLDCSDCPDIDRCNRYYEDTGESYGCSEPYDYRFKIRGRNR